MRNFSGPEGVAYRDIIAEVETKIPAPPGAAWRKRSWRSHAIRKNGLTHTELAAVTDNQKGSEPKQPASTGAETESPDSPAAEDLLKDSSEPQDATE